LAHERAKLLKRQQEAVATFDEAVGDLRREKFRLEAELKSADMKRLVLYQEFMLLKVGVGTSPTRDALLPSLMPPSVPGCPQPMPFAYTVSPHPKPHSTLTFGSGWDWLWQESEKQDSALKGKMDGKMTERADILTKMSECQEKLELKREEVEAVLGRKKAVGGEFDGLVEESNAYYDALHKIFLRKIKRLKKKVKDDDDADYDSEEDEEVRSRMCLICESDE
jgi:hypothetical protein